MVTCTSLCAGEKLGRCSNSNENSEQSWTVVTVLVGNLMICTLLIKLYTVFEELTPDKQWHSAVQETELRSVFEPKKHGA